MTKYFVDTNILIYAFDKKAGKKHDIAKRLLKDFYEQENAAISVQVLQEFCVNLQKRGVAISDCVELVEELSSLQVIENTVNITGLALSVQKKYKISFWDSVIIAAAQSAEVDIVLTEDLSHKQKYGKVRVLNPFIE